MAAGVGYISSMGLASGWADFLRRRFSHELMGVEEEAVSGLSCDALIAMVYSHRWGNGDVLSI